MLLLSESVAKTRGPRHELCWWHQGGVRASEAFQGASVSAPPAKSRQTPPFSLRLTFEERARLEREAGDMPLGAYTRSKLFEEPASDRHPRQRKRLVKDHLALSQLLGELGRARIANNLNQLAKAANTGSLPLTPETENSLREACAGIHWMRIALMQALGLQA